MLTVTAYDQVARHAYLRAIHAHRHVGFDAVDVKLPRHYINHFAVGHPLAEHFPLKSLHDVFGHLGVCGETAFGLPLYRRNGAACDRGIDALNLARRQAVFDFEQQCAHGVGGHGYVAELAVTHAVGQRHLLNGFDRDVSVWVDRSHGALDFAAPYFESDDMLFVHIA